MIKRLFNFIAITFVALLLVGCGDKACISADDWGYPKVHIAANGKDMNLAGEMAEQSVDGIGPAGGQIIIDAERVPLVISVEEDDKWTSWFGGPVRGSRDSATNGSEVGTDATSKGNWFTNIEDVIPVHKECLYQQVAVGTGGVFAPKYKKARALVEGSNQPFTCPGPTEIVSNPDRYADCWVPCWFKDGMGLYIGLSPDGGGQEDVVVSKHIPDAKKPEIPKLFDPTNNMPNYEAREQDGYLVRGFAVDEIPGALTGDAVYFKIVDLFYEDNYGGYNIKIKSGTRNPDMGPLETVFDAFYRPINNMMKRIYTGVVSNPEYINTVRALLALYIVFFGYAYLMGMIEKPKSEFLMRVIKIGLIIQLISPDSWEFFYTHLFQAFVEGVIQIAALVSTPFPDYDPNSPWFSLDEALRKFGSAETASKVGSTLFSNAAGFVFIIIFYVALALFVVSLIKALTIYIVAYIGVAFLIALAPLFFIFLLFEKTKGIFEEFISHLIAFSIQQIILFAGLGLFAALIYYYLTQTVGYRVCWETWFKFSVFGVTLFDLKYWFPNIRDLQADLWMDWGNGVYQFYTDYRPEATDNPSMWPFIDVPYFDPNKELLKINEYRTESDFISLGDVFVFLAAVYLMFNFMSFVPALSNSLKGGGNKRASADIFGGGFRLWNNALGIGNTAKNVGKFVVGDISRENEKGPDGLTFNRALARNADGSIKKGADGKAIKTKRADGSISFNSSFGRFRWSGGAVGSMWRSGNKAWSDVKSGAKGFGKSVVNDAMKVKEAATGKSELQKALDYKNEKAERANLSSGGAEIEHVTPEHHEVEQKQFSLEEKIKSDQKKASERMEEASKSKPGAGKESKSDDSKKQGNTPPVERSGVTTQQVDQRKAELEQQRKSELEEKERKEEQMRAEQEEKKIKAEQDTLDGEEKADSARSAAEEARKSEKAQKEMQQKQMKKASLESELNILKSQLNSTTDASERIALEDKIKDINFEINSLK